MGSKRVIRDSIWRSGKLLAVDADVGEILCKILISMREESRE